MNTQQSTTAFTINGITTTLPNTTTQLTLNNQNLNSIVVGSLTVINGTCNAGQCAANATLRENIEYSVNAPTGRLFIINQTGTFNVTGSYYPTAYVGNSFVRTIYTALIPLIALGVMLWIVAKVFMGNE